jgi:WS/DGAT/MGAT family acyltransferase
MELFDAEREPAPDDRPVPAGTAEELAGLRLAWESLEYDAGRLSGLLRALPRTYARTALRTLRSPVASVRDAVRTATSVSRFVAPVFDTKSPVMRDRRLSRRFDVLDVPLDDLHHAAHAGGGHLNDAFLAAVTGGLRRYHERHDATVDQLRVTLPISLRRPDDPPGGHLITLVRLALPAGLPDPAERMTAIRHVIERWRREPALALTQPIAAALNLLPNGVVGSMFKHVDFLASNVPGFPIPIYLAGAEVEGYYPFGPTIGASVNVTLLSYVDRCCIGVNCDTAAVPDVDVLVACLREGFDEVLDLIGAHAPVRRPMHEGTVVDLPA